MKNDTKIIADSKFSRLDSFLSQKISQTRSFCQKLISNGNVSINGVVVEKVSQGVNVGDVVEAKIPDATPLDVVPQNIDIEVVYQDAHLAVINKPQGISVHPSNNIMTDTLVNALLFHIKDLSGINGILRPGIVHRLDKDTSGLLVVAKNDAAHQKLQTQIQNKTCKRIYVALLEGVLKLDSGTVDQPIARSKTDRKKMAIDPQGRQAQTNFEVLQRFKKNTLVQFELKTGRTHQIRVHAKFLGHPVVGDKAYGFKNQRFNLNGQLLHAKQLQFCHPSTNQTMSFEAEIPPYFQRVLNILQTEKTD